jgi:DNA-binding GntR family transcriptional regulator
MQERGHPRRSSFGFVEVDRDSMVPVWQQVTDDLRRRIESGELRGMVPGINRLAEEYGIARNTAVKVLAALTQQGVIVSVHGKGHYVNRSAE